MTCGHDLRGDCWKECGVLSGGGQKGKIGIANNIINKIYFKMEYQIYYIIIRNQVYEPIFKYFSRITKGT